MEVSKLKTEVDEAAAIALKDKNEIERITAELGLAQATAKEAEDQRLKLKNEITALKTRFELQTAELSKVETQISLFRDLIMAGDTNDSGKK